MSVSPLWFAIPDVDEKLRALPAAVHAALACDTPTRSFTLGRDLPIVERAALPGKLGLNSDEGLARLLHDLANIELQATELALRELIEFPEAPAEFREQLAELALSEGRHLALCLRSLRDLGFHWGAWPAHLALWNAVGDQDTLLDRVLIVHRYLEGSGLDAGESLLRRLSGVANKNVRQAVKLIVGEEVDHVRFGSRWYHTFARAQGLDPEADFRARIGRIVREAPRKERLAIDLRRRAGFTEGELIALEEARLELLAGF